MLTTLDWFIDVCIPAVFEKLDSWYVVANVSLLGIYAAIFVIWHLYRRFV